MSRAWQNIFVRLTSSSTRPHWRRTSSITITGTPSGSAVATAGPGATVTSALTSSCPAGRDGAGLRRVTSGGLVGAAGGDSGSEGAAVPPRRCSMACTRARRPSTVGSISGRHSRISAISSSSLGCGLHRASLSAAERMFSTRRMSSMVVRSACAASAARRPSVVSRRSTSRCPVLTTRRSRNWSINVRITWRMSFPSSTTRPTRARHSATSRAMMAPAKPRAVCSSTTPRTVTTSREVIGPAANAVSWSRIDSASRTDPSALPAISASALSSMANPSPAAMSLSRATISFCDTRRKSNRWQRDRIVAGRRCGSVVTRTRMAWAGGSSSVFRRALAASVVSMWASSMM